MRYTFLTQAVLYTLEGLHAVALTVAEGVRPGPQRLARRVNDQDDPSLLNRLDRTREAPRARTFD